MDTLTTGTTIDNLSQSTSTFTVSNGLLLWTGVIIGCLVVVICLLTWLLFKREKALQLLSFTISPLGINLSYQLNTKEKLRLLALDNIALQSEIKVLKVALDKEKYSSIRMIIAFFFVFILLVILAKLNLKKTDKTADIDK